MTNFRKLCDELLDELKYQTDWSIAEELKERASTALAEPEPEGPTDEELLCIAAKSIDPYDQILPGEYEPETDSVVEVYSSELIIYARAVLARWSNHPGSPDSSTPQPIPVTERLPGPEDCIANPRNGQGQWCWGWCVDDSAVLFSGRWRMIRRQWLADEAVAWLPAHALPVPSWATPPSMSDHPPLSTDMNADRWAKEFVALHGGDEDLMRTWFANAIMCGWDNHYCTTSEYKTTISKHLTSPS